MLHSTMNAASASTMLNSARCRAVCEFSALNVGPTQAQSQKSDRAKEIYHHENDHAVASYTNRVASRNSSGDGFEVKLGGDSETCLCTKELSGLVMAVRALQEISR